MVASHVLDIDEIALGVHQIGEMQLEMSDTLGRHEEYVFVVCGLPNVGVPLLSPMSMLVVVVSN
jgi:hypothetical protein